MARTSQRQPWYVRLWQLFLRDRLGLFALVMVVSGFVCLLIPIGSVQGIGGIIFGAGLTVTISLWSNRQQAAKDTNLRRKTEFYGPLQAEMQTLRERLEEAQRGIKPYLQQIMIAGQNSTQQLKAAPQLYLWSEFKKDYRDRLEFSEASRQMFDRILQLAQDYNAAVDRALETSEAAFIPCIKAAIAEVEQHNDFQQWCEAHPEIFKVEVFKASSSSTLPNDWFALIEYARRGIVPVGTPRPPNPETAWAIWCLKAALYGGRPATLGWLLAKNCDQAVQAIHSALSNRFPPPPLKWLKAIVACAWPALESHPTYVEARDLHEKLTKQVSLAETKLLNKLHAIQEMYEGGQPLL